MPSMRIIKTTSEQWGVLAQMRGVLLKIGAERATEQASGRGDAGGDCPAAGRTWPGRGSGVRGPEPDETPLSESEVEFLFSTGLRHG